MTTDPARLRALRAQFDRLLDLELADRAEALARLAVTDPAQARDVARLLEQDAVVAGTATQNALADFAVAAGAEDDGPSLIGRRIGVYVTTGQLGVGGMGVVLAAEREDGELRQQVAIKLVRRELLAPSLLRRFSTERAVLAALDHPSICRFLDAGTLDDGTPYVVMERVFGSSLMAWCADRRLDLRRRVALFRDVVGAVSHAHRRLVVHRDIKPANVLVHDDGRPKLLDFGIAASLAAAHAKTMTAERFFTPGNAAPEQLRGEPVSVACDIYGLGTVLYELLCARPPFVVDGLRPAEVERLVLEVPPPSLANATPRDDAIAALHGARNARDWSAALRGDLDAIVQRCLRKDPAERYSSVEQLDADLAAWMEQRPVSARGGDTRYRLRKFLRRHRTAVAVGAMAVLLGAATTAAFTLQALDVRAQRDRAEQAVRLLRDAFVEADPARSTGTAVTAQQILANASTRLDALRTRQPELYADLATTLGDVYFALGDAPRAGELSARAIEAWAAAHGSTQLPEPLRVLHGNALLDMRKLADVEALLADAERSGQRSDEIELLRARWHLLSGDIDESLRRIEALLPKVQALAPDDEFGADVRRTHVDALRSGSRFEDALRSLEATLAWQRAGLPENHPRLIQTRVVGLTVLRRLGRFDEALAQSMALERLVADAYGTRNSIYAITISALAQAQSGLGRHDEAVATYRRAVSLWESLVGPQHDNTLRAEYNLVRVLTQRPETRADGLAALAALVARTDEALGSRHVLSGFFRLSLAGWLLEDGDSRAALAQLAGAAGRESLLGASGVNLSEHLRLAAEAARAQGCLADGATPVPAVDGTCDDYVAMLELAPRQ